MVMLTADFLFERRQDFPVIGGLQLTRRRARSDREARRLQQR
jgi:hypothetical protein